MSDENESAPPAPDPTEAPPPTAEPAPDAMEVVEHPSMDSQAYSEEPAENVIRFVEYRDADD